MLNGAALAREQQHEYASDLDWRRAHRALTQIATDRAAQDFEEARWIVAAKRAGLHEKLGFASMIEYLERIFGYSPRLAGEKIRVAIALVDLPETAQSLKDGVLNWSAVREISRVATKATEAKWLDGLRAKSVREIESAVWSAAWRSSRGPCAF